MTAVEWIVWQNGFEWGLGVGALVGVIVSGVAWWLRQ
jgi:hypothetical protein